MTQRAYPRELLLPELTELLDDIWEKHRQAPQPLSERERALREAFELQTIVRGRVWDPNPRRSAP